MKGVIRCPECDGQRQQIVPQPGCEHLMMAIDCQVCDGEGEVEVELTDFDASEREFEGRFGSVPIPLNFDHSVDVRARFTEDRHEIRFWKEVTGG